LVTLKLITTVLLAKPVFSMFVSEIEISIGLEDVVQAVNNKNKANTPKLSILCMVVVLWED
jgi:hypothetical protein